MSIYRQEETRTPLAVDILVNDIKLLVNQKSVCFQVLPMPEGRILFSDFAPAVNCCRSKTVRTTITELGRGHIQYLLAQDESPFLSILLFCPCTVDIGWSSR